MFRENITNNVTQGKVTTMLNAIRRFVMEEEGAAAAEYALLLALIALGISVAAALLGTNIAAAINRAATCVAGGAC